MKKFTFIYIALFAAIFAYAEEVEVILSNGKVMKGELVMYNESLLILEPNTIVKYEKKLKPEEVDYFKIDNVGVFHSRGGMFILDESTKKQETPNLAADSVTEASKDFWQRVLSERSPNNKNYYSNPNEFIGRGFLQTGGVALGIGIPCLVAGVATCIAGNVNITLSNVVTKANCAEASYYLLGFGASMTIISIPLLVHGRHIADMKFNYTGNGAGLAVAF